MIIFISGIWNPSDNPNWSSEPLSRLRSMLPFILASIIMNTNVNNFNMYYATKLYLLISQYHVDTLFPLIRDGHLAIMIVAHYSNALRKSVMIKYLCMGVNHIIMNEDYW